MEGRPEERIVSAVSLRSMQQARYADANLGHFGLAAQYYTHFTSPIRRYPDLIVHRLLRETFATGSMSAKKQDYVRGILPEIATHTSLRERVAVEAERETTEMKEIEYMTQFVGDTFTGVISGVTAFGIFVELENGVEGLVHVSRMVNDYYEYVEEQYALIGERTRKSYQLGDEVEVVLVRASVEERNIDFILKDNGVYVSDGQEKAKKGSSPKSVKAEKPADKKKASSKKKAAKKEVSKKEKSKKAAKKSDVKTESKKAAKKSSEKKTSGTKEKTKRDSSRKVNPILDGLPSKAVWPDPKPAAEKKPRGGRRKDKE